MPNNFLQKHFCQWCKDENDAHLFSRRRINSPSFKGTNTVILGRVARNVAGGLVKNAGWQVTTKEKDGIWREVCTHKYVPVVKCSDININNDNANCFRVGDECKTFHTPDYWDPRL